MKKAIIILNIILTTIFIFVQWGCRHSTGKIKLVFQIIPDNYYDKYWYYVDWENPFTDKHKEIWCFITNKNNDTLGYYKGLSTPLTFANFDATDSIVILNFMLGLDFFSFDEETEFKEYTEKYKIPVAFKPIEINVKTDCRKKYKVELEEHKN